MSTDPDQIRSSTDPDQIRSEIDQTQRELSADVDALTEKISPPRIPELLATAGLACTFVACSGRGMTVYVIEVEGFVPVSDKRLGAFRSELGAAFERLLPLGGYAVPLSSSALAIKG